MGRGGIDTIGRGGLAMTPRGYLVAIVALVLAGCAPATPPREGAPARAGSALGQPAATPKTLTVGLDDDLKNIWGVMTEGGGGSDADGIGLVINQSLAENTADGTAQPRLLAELPSVERGTWSVLPNGGMQTTLRLRPNAVWHDGTRFTADDVIFSWQVFRDPDVPNSRRAIVELIDRMDVVDPTTVLVTWSQTYPFADRLGQRELFLLPRHLLEPVYRQEREALATQPYFGTAEYVGLGPFRVASWSTGSHLELTAFDQYFLGRPKLNSIRIQFISDPNTLMANLNAQAVQTTFGSRKLEWDALMLLKRSWEASGYGTTLIMPRNYKFAEAQKLHNPQPPELTDPRVRRALLHAINRPELAHAVYGADGVVADSWVHPSFARHAQLQDTITRYPFDPRRASAILEEAGWSRGADGVLQKDGRAFAMTIRDTEGEAQPLIVADYWRAIGVASEYEHRGAAAQRDRQDRATFTGITLITNPIEILGVVRKLASYNIPTAANRWTGTNRGGWSSPAWDDLNDRMLAALDDSKRLGIEREMLQLYTTELPLMPLFFTLQQQPVGGGLVGPAVITGTAPNDSAQLTWNIHEWDIQPKR
jgi:peptide/nickel transport system substrate-binding protein